MYIQSCYNTRSFVAHKQNLNSKIHKNNIILVFAKYINEFRSLNIYFHSSKPK